MSGYIFPHEQATLMYKFYGIAEMAVHVRGQICTVSP